VSIGPAFDAAEPGRARLRFSVRDTGIGTDETQLARLFRPFDQLDASTTRRYGGTGLGLAISQQLVRRMGGEIGVRTTPGRGSEFFFTLGFEVVADAAAGATREYAAPTDAIEWLEGWRILLVEDNELNRIVAVDLPHRVAGARVTEAHTGIEALQRAREGTADGGFDLVLMDVQMPEMDGLEATKRMRADPALAGLPIVGLTAQDSASIGAV
jgi:CheY-like chemotaxis protein